LAEPQHSAPPGANTAQIDRIKGIAIIISQLCKNAILDELTPLLIDPDCGAKPRTFCHFVSLFERNAPSFGKKSYIFVLRAARWSWLE